MAKKFAGFTPDQEFTLLSKMGYTGPKDTTEMENFKASSPGVSQRMGKLTQKATDRFMNRPVESGETPGFAAGGTVVRLADGRYNIKGTNQIFSDMGTAYSVAQNYKPYVAPTPKPAAPAPAATTQTATATATPKPTDPIKKEVQVTGDQATQTGIVKPTDLVPTPAKPADVTATADQLIDPATGQQKAPNIVTPTTVTETAQATAPTQTATNTVDATKVADQIKAETDNLQAATAQPTKAATVQGQLEGLMAQFEGGATPPWASGAMRQAMTIMQQRGIGASSMAGAAVVQAAMESAIGIASQDAATQAQFEMKNLDNQQQTLIFKTQQRIAGLFSDQAADNAAKQFNAASKNQTDQFFAGLQESVSRFNADQVNSIRQFNAGETNAIDQFNSQMQAQRDQFSTKHLATFSTIHLSLEALAEASPKSCSSHYFTLLGIRGAALSSGGATGASARGSTAPVASAVGSPIGPASLYS